MTTDDDERVAALTPDLADLVRHGAMELGKAETIFTRRVHDALDTLTHMGRPARPELFATLSWDDREALAAILDALDAGRS